VRVDTSLQEYILELVRATRQDEEISLGVSPRGTVALQKAIQARAFLAGRDYAQPDDIKFLAPYVLAHRLIPVSGRRGTTVMERLLRSIPVGV
jgi:MoxR-like ATPase